MLGPVTVETPAGSSDGTLFAPRDRVVLSVLAMRRGEIVPAEVLADALWGDQPPHHVAQGRPGVHGAAPAHPGPRGDPHAGTRLRPGAVPPGGGQPPLRTAPGTGPAAARARRARPRGVHGQGGPETVAGSSADRARGLGAGTRRGPAARGAAPGRRGPRGRGVPRRGTVPRGAAGRPGPRRHGTAPGDPLGTPRPGPVPGRPPGGCPAHAAPGG